MYKDEKELSSEHKIKLAEQIIETGIDYVCISGGDPFLLRELEKIVKILVDGNVRVSVFTSGIVIDESRIKALSNLGTFFYVSVDGDPKTHNMIRGNTWHKVEKFLNLLKNVGARFGTCMAISRLNYDKTDLYIDTVLRYDPDLICVIPVMPSGRAIETGLYVEQDHVKISLQKIEEKCREHGVKVRVWCLPCLRAYMESPYLLAGTCRSWDVIDISPSGRLLICDILNMEICRWSMDKNLNELVSLYKNSIIYRRSRSIPSECSQCIFVGSCLGGCFARSYIRYGVFERKDPLCPLS